VDSVAYVEPLDRRTDVYDLEVDGAHCFFANGVLVHNCHDALQYVCLYVRSMSLPSLCSGAPGRGRARPVRQVDMTAWS
jgi:hypothetical protein